MEAKLSWEGVGESSVFPCEIQHNFTSLKLGRLHNILIIFFFFYLSYTPKLLNEHTLVLYNYIFRVQTTYVIIFKPLFLTLYCPFSVIYPHDMGDFRLTTT